MMNDIQGVILSEHIHTNINLLMDDILTNTTYKYFKYILSKIEWEFNNSAFIDNILCTYVILIGRLHLSIEDIVSYRGTLLLHDECENFLWNDVFHPEVRIFKMIDEEQMYLKMISYTIKNGSQKIDKNNISMRSIFGKQLEFSLTNKRIPIITSRRIIFKDVLHELLWFLKGCPRSNYLKRHGVHKWEGSSDLLVGPIYGYQWRRWGADHTKRDEKGIDQISNIITSLRLGDYSNRRLILSAWNVSDLYKMVLPPCHCFCQFYVSEIGLCCSLTLRSSDVFMGLPSNIACYAILTRMIAHVTQLPTDKLVVNLGEVYMYENHIQQCIEQIKHKTYEFPKLHITSKTDDIDELTYEDFNLNGYTYTRSPI